MIKPFKNNEKFFGTTTVGQKGQVVIPVEARSRLKLKTGEKLLVFGMAHDMLVISKLSDFEKLASLMTRRLKSISKIIKKNARS